MLRMIAFLTNIVYNIYPHNGFKKHVEQQLSEQHAGHFTYHLSGEAFPNLAELQ